MSDDKYTGEKRAYRVPGWLGRAWNPKMRLVDMALRGIRTQDIYLELFMVEF